MQEVPHGPGVDLGGRISTLLRKCLIRVRETVREGGRPERTLYEITDDGLATFYAWLRSILSTPVREFPVFPAAVSFMMVLTPEDVARQLSARATALGEKLAASRAAVKAARSKGLPRLFLLEDEYRQAMMRAEIDWLASVIADLRSEKITWSKDWIRKVAEAVERDPPV